MAFVISVQISEQEHNEDREEYIDMILKGEREIIGDDDNLLSIKQIHELTRKQLEEHGDVEMGEEWDFLWAYADGAGLDPYGALTFSTREEAEAHVLKHYTPTTDTVEIFEWKEVTI